MHGYWTHVFHFELVKHLFPGDFLLSKVCFVIYLPFVVLNHTLQALGPFLRVILRFTVYFVIYLPRVQFMQALQPSGPFHIVSFLGYQLFSSTHSLREMRQHNQKIIRKTLG